MDESRIRLPRRNLVLAGALGGAGAAASLVPLATRKGQDGLPSHNQQREGRGYRVTEHVTRYYQSART